MTIGASVALIIIGAVLKFGVTWHAKNVDIQVIGVILMIAGAAGLVISVTLLMMRRNDMRRRSAPPPPGQVPGQVYEDRPYNEPPV